MSYKEFLDEAGKGGQGPLHVFKMSFHPARSCLYMFVEGYDDPSFYKSHVGPFVSYNDGISTIICHGKEGVLHSLLDFPWKKYPEVDVLFFVDRDLSYYLGEAIPTSPHLYVTPGYSFENELAKKQTFARCITELLGAKSMTPIEIDYCTTLWINALEIFADSMKPIMASIILGRRNGNNLRLNKLRPERLFTYKDGYIELKQRYTSLESRIKWYCSETGQERIMIEAVNEIMDDMDPYHISTVRGKYVLRFMVEYLNNLRQDMPQIITRFSAPPVNPTSIGFKNGAAIIAPRAVPPPCLRGFAEALGPHMANGSHSACVRT